jgi:TatD DNase family protein
MFIDIAANLTDDMFQGVYHDRRKHEPDLGAVIERARQASVDKMIVLAGTLSDAHKCLEICNTFDEKKECLFTTVGFHPTRCGEAAELVAESASDKEAEKTIGDAFDKFINTADERVVAIGEFGLDYDRLHFCPKHVQKRFFDIQLKVASTRFPTLPLLLHLRNATDDFIEIIGKYKVHGVVHSFTGTTDEMKRLVDMGLYIGINGCSLRESLDVIPDIPEDKLIFETDAPYCDIRQTHPSYPFLSGLSLPSTVKPEKFTFGSLVKGRNEPGCINQVAFVVAKVRNSDYLALSQKVKSNTLRLFRLISN